MNTEISQSVLDKINEEAEIEFPLGENFCLIKRSAYKAGRLKSIEAEAKIEKLEKELERVKVLVKEGFMLLQMEWKLAKHIRNEKWEKFKSENNL